jgi:Protein of unknown function (DUF3455)
MSRLHPLMQPRRKTRSCTHSATLVAVTIRLLLAFVLGGALTLAGAQSITRPSVPDQIQAPAGEEVLLVAHASGSQIYTCDRSADGAYAWKLKAPDAELRDSQGTLIGRHFAGPTWKHNDGSEVTGKMTAKADSPDKDSIPWLLVSATGHSGNGILSQVITIQRIHTKGGQPPASADCNSSKQAADAKSPYTADYYFYAAPK